LTEGQESAQPTDPAQPKTSTSTQGRILLVTKGLLEKNGYARVSTEKVAKATVISKRTLYQFYPSKINLVKGLFIESVRLVRAGNADLEFASPDKFPTELGKFISNFCNEFGCFRESLLAELDKEHPLVSKRIRIWKSKFLGFTVKRILERGQLIGSVRNDIEIRALTAVVIIAIATIANDGVSPRSDMTLDPEMALDILIHGFLR